MMQDISAPAPEAKGAGDAPSAGDAAAAFDQFMNVFHAFKEANDERLAEIERRQAADALSEEKVARLNRTLDEHGRRLDGLALKESRPPRGGPDGGSARLTEHKAAFEAYARRGDAGPLLALEGKAMRVGSDPDGGYLVPPEVEAEIDRRLTAVSPIRAIADVRQVSSSLYRRPFAVTGPAVGWVGETEARPETVTPTLTEAEYPVMELYAMPAATQTLLDDAVVDLDRWLAAEIDMAFAEQETAAFVNGDAVRKPRGFLTYPLVAEGAWAWGSLGFVDTGAAGAFAASGASDVLIDVIYGLKAGYRQNAHFVMNRRTEAAIRKLKDADGNYLWAPPGTAGARATILNFPIVEVEDMPDIAAGSTAIAFGDFRRGYLIVDRAGIRVLRDPYSHKPYVLFYTTKRVGGGVKDFDAIKLVRFGTA